MAAPPLIVVQVWDHDLDVCRQQEKVAREDGYRFCHPIAISVSSVSVSSPNKSGTLDSEAATKSRIICMHPATLHG
uniref:Uncharacterized protein n=2 Tax=Oryza TaxID=4527 RepID=A0A0D3GSU2_9ORYZ